MTQYGKLVFVDLETTGANAAADRITEIGLVEVDQEGKVSRWSTLVNPERPIPPFIQGLTGINDAMVRHAPTFAVLAREVLARLDGALFIAHNARFDYGFLRNALREAGYALRCEVLCTVKLSRKLFPEEPRHNLDALIARHDLKPDGRHRALADADLLWQLWSRLQTRIEPDLFAQAVQAQLQRPCLPAHLPANALDDIPDTPGVYLFYGERDVPLYVGKSIHLRQRVLSHFNSDHRLFKDMRISHEIHRLEWRTTAGEIGALLLEAQLVKKMQPVHNRVLRRQKELCAWHLRENDTGQITPALTYASEQDFAGADRLYGLFTSKRKAESTLRELADAHRLCLAVLGLENRAAVGKPCFGYQLHRCDGACIGAEPAELHLARLETALAGLRVETWPFRGPVALVEQGEERHDVHVVHNWCYLGTARSEDEVWALLNEAPARPTFDIDTYKILTRALARRQLKVRLLANEVEARDAA
jgi:DNA polymerase-3 subunit epsilon